MQICCWSFLNGEIGAVILENTLKIIVWFERVKRKKLTDFNPFSSRSDFKFSLLTAIKLIWSRLWEFTVDSRQHLILIRWLPLFLPPISLKWNGIVRRSCTFISALPRSCPCVEFYFTEGPVFVFCQLKLSASGKMVPCENVKIDWGLNAVRIHFH